MIQGRFPGMSEGFQQFEHPRGGNFTSIGVGQISHLSVYGFIDCLCFEVDVRLSIVRIN